MRIQKTKISLPKFRNKRIGIACNNAGGAEIIKQLILKNKLKCKYCLTGPSIEIFNVKKNFKKKELVNNSDLIILGTSVPSDFESTVIKLARKKKIKTISILDHWTNYKKRFFSKKKYIYPDQIWSGDLYSYFLAKKVFKEKTFFFKNPLFEVFKKNKNKYDFKLRKNILFASSNIKRIGYNEINLINKIFLNKKFNFKKIIIKPHPSENIDLMLKNLKKKNLINKKIIITKEKKLEKLFKKTHTVIGNNSMVLALAKFSGLKTINLLNNMQKNTLPKIFIDKAMYT